MKENNSITRREFNHSLSASIALPMVTTLPSIDPLTPTPQSNAENTDSRFKFNFMLPSCMYGYEKLDTILPEAEKIDASAIDIWPKVHGDQREQVDQMGQEKFAELLDRHKLKLGCITQYKLGPFGLQKEMKFAQHFSCNTMVTGGHGPTKLKGSELKSAVKKFAVQMKPHLETAAEASVTIAIENHGNNLIDSPDSLKWLVELCPDKHLGIALAPYHLDQDPNAIAALIKSLGNRMAIFYAWQHGMGCMKKLPKEQELLQMPGRGELDFKPIVAALQSIKFSGWTEIFMHPFPRGVKIMETVAEVTHQINQSRDYLNQCIAAK